MVWEGDEVFAYSIHPKTASRVDCARPSRLILGVTIYLNNHGLSLYSLSMETPRSLTEKKQKESKDGATEPLRWEKAKTGGSR